MSLHIETQGRGAPLLLIHGWGMHGGMWGEMADRLAQDHRVITVDLPGHGSSRLADRVSTVGGSALDMLVDELAGRFDEAMTLCGWSLGGQVALRWAQRYPQQVERLVLVASTPCFVRQPGWACAMEAATLAAFADALQQNYAQTLRRFLALQLRGSERERELLTELRAVLFSRGEPDLNALRSGLDILRDCDLREGLSGVVQSALVIAGERDTLTPPQASRYMAEQLAQAELATIAGAAHAPFLSHPDEFVECLQRFLHE